MKCGLKTNRWLFVKFAVLSVICAAIYAQTSSAMVGLNNTGPNISNNSDGRYNLSNHTTHSSTSLSIPVYVKPGPGGTCGQIPIHIYNFYSGHGGTASFAGGPSYVSGDASYSINSSMDTVTNTGYCRGTVDATLNMGWASDSVAQFRVEVPGNSSALVGWGGGYASVASGNYPLYYNGNANSTVNMVETQAVYFAPPCTLTQAGTYNVKLYDLDTISGMDDRGGINGGHDLYLTVTDETTGANLGTYNGWDHPVEMGERGILNIPIWVEPGHKYKIEINTVWIGNLIEYELPFDNIAYATGCSDMDGQSFVGTEGREGGLSDGKAINRELNKYNVRPGQQLFFDHEISNGGDNDIKAGALSIDILHDRHGDNPQSYKLATGLKNGSGSKDQSIFAYRSKTYNVTQDDVGNKVCEHMEWTESGKGNGSSAEACADVPYHYPNDGDPNDGTGVKITTVIDGGVTSVDGGNVTFNYKFHNSGPTKSKAIHYKTYYFLLTDKDALPEDFEKQVIDNGVGACDDPAGSGDGGPARRSGASPQLKLLAPKDQDPSGKHGILHLKLRTITLHVIKHHQEIDHYETHYSSWTDSSGVAHTFSYQVPVYVWKDGYSSFTIAYRDNHGDRWYNNGDFQQKLDYEKMMEILPSSMEVADMAAFNSYANQAANNSGYACKDTSNGAVEGTVQQIPADSDVYGPASNTVSISGDWQQDGALICSYAVIDSGDWSINNGVSNAPGHAASNIECARIGKRPSAQITGADSYANGGFAGAEFKQSSSTTSGSYSQQGLITSYGPVTNFGSGNYTWSTNNFCKLIYANVDGVNSGAPVCTADGSYGNGKFSPNLTASLAPHPKAGSSSVSGLKTGTYTYSGDITLGSGNYPAAGQQVTLILESGSVTLNGNVGPDENASYSDPSQIPNLTLIIKQGDVYVNSGGAGGVQKIAGNYIIEKGRFYSCAEAKDVKSGTSDKMFGENGTCDKKLKINGSVYSAQAPQLRRVFGAGKTGGDDQTDGNRVTTSAEWFNYGPQVWLSAYLAGTNTPIGYNTINVVSLPVRY